MSWSISTGKVPKENVREAIDALALTAGTDGGSPGPCGDQLATGKEAAKVLCATIPGPFVNVLMNGHANATGWQKKQGYANDYISITVSQITE